jgi:hypothetical protein
LHALANVLYRVDSSHAGISMRLVVVIVVFLLVVPAQGALLDPDSPGNTTLDALTPLLHVHNIDVARNLNAAPSKPRRRPARPRLGMLADIPLGTLADSPELERWETDYTLGKIAALVALPKKDLAQSDGDFLEAWMDTQPSSRTFVTYAVADQETAILIQRQLGVLGYEAQVHEHTEQVPDATIAARFYATAGQRLVVDSIAARKLDGRALELSLMTKKLYRKSDSVFTGSGKSSRYYAKGEPKRFRKADLGDETMAATIPEIIVSGGIALGERATFQQAPVALIFQSDHSFRLVLEDGAMWQFPSMSPLMLKACFDFALRSLKIDSDAIIDIDEHRKIGISRAFRNTDIGYELIGIDEQPFRFVDNISAIKSVIIDTGVSIHGLNARALFTTDYEVRFINPDRRKLAETRVALAFRYDSEDDSSVFQNSWGPRAFRVNDIDFPGLGKATRKVAVVAAWVALFREIEASSIDFSRGRYEFLKIDKAGVATPRLSKGL